MEQPTLFYAIALTLALIGGRRRLSTLMLAWAYVGLADRCTAWSRRRSTSSPSASSCSPLASLCLIGLTVQADADGLQPPRPSGEKAPTSSTWVDQRNWPTGLTQSSR